MLAVSGIEAHIGTLGEIEEIKTIRSANDKANHWHFDPVPMGYGKIFFYFSSSLNTDGKTNFMSFIMLVLTIDLQYRFILFSHALQKAGITTYRGHIWPPLFIVGGLRPPLLYIYI